MRLKGGKKRYYVSLLEKDAERFKTLLDEVGIPSNFFSAYIGSCIVGFIPTLELIKKQIAEGSTFEGFPVVDLIQAGLQGGAAAGKQISLFEYEESSDKKEPINKKKKISKK